MPNLALTPSTVTAARTIALWALRAIAAFLIIRGGYFVLQRLVFSLFAGQVAAWQTWLEIGNTSHRGSVGIAMLIVGGALAFASGLIARWMTPVPADGCPRCGYTRDAPGDEGALSDDTRCPECGLQGVNAPSNDG